MNVKITCDSRVSKLNDKDELIEKNIVKKFLYKKHGYIFYVK